MSTTLAWVWGVWYVSPEKFSAPIFQLRRDAPALRAAELDAALALAEVEVEEERGSRRGTPRAAAPSGRGWRRPARGTTRRRGAGSSDWRRLVEARPRRRTPPRGTARRRAGRCCGRSTRGTGSGSATRCRARPGTPACPCGRHMLSTTWTAPFSSRDDDERVVDDPAHDVVAGLGDLGLVGQEQPGAREEPLASRGRRSPDRCRSTPGSGPASTLAITSASSMVPCTPSHGEGSRGPAQAGGVNAGGTLGAGRNPGPAGRIMLCATPSPS